MALSEGAKAGIVIGVIIVIAIAIAVWYWWWKLRVARAVISTASDLLSGGLNDISQSLGGKGFTGGAQPSIGKKAYDMNFSDHVDF